MNNQNETKTPIDEEQLIMLGFEGIKERVKGYGKLKVGDFYLEIVSPYNAFFYNGDRMIIRDVETLKMIIDSRTPKKA